MRVHAVALTSPIKEPAIQALNMSNIEQGTKSENKRGNTIEQNREPYIKPYVTLTLTLRKSYPLGLVLGFGFGFELRFNRVKVMLRGELWSPIRVKGKVKGNG